MGPIARSCYFVDSLKIGKGGGGGGGGEGGAGSYRLALDRFMA